MTRVRQLSLKEATMEQETRAQSTSQAETTRDVSGVPHSPADAVSSPPTSSEATSPGVAGSASIPYVYAIGRIEARFPRLSVEKEFAQAAGRAVTAAQTDQ